MVSINKRALAKLICDSETYVLQSFRKIQDTSNFIVLETSLTIIKELYPHELILCL